METWTLCAVCSSENRMKNLNHCCCSRLTSCSSHPRSSLPGHRCGFPSARSKLRFATIVRWASCSGPPARPSQRCLPVWHPRPLRPRSPSWKLVRERACPRSSPHKSEHEWPSPPTSPRNLSSCSATMTASTGRGSRAVHGSMWVSPLACWSAYGSTDSPKRTRCSSSHASALTTRRR